MCVCAAADYKMDQKTYLMQRATTVNKVKRFTFKNKCNLPSLFDSSMDDLDRERILM